MHLKSGQWTEIKIIVADLRAEHSVKRAEQPGLIVKNLKLGASEGQIALWIGAGAEAHFAPITVRPLE